MNVPWASVIALTNNAATNDDTLSFCNANNLSCSSPPISFHSVPGVARAETRVARFRVPKSTGIVDFEYSTILDGGADKCVFEMKWKSG